MPKVSDRKERLMQTLRRVPSDLFKEAIIRQLQWEPTQFAEDFVINGVLGAMGSHPVLPPRRIAEGTDREKKRIYARRWREKQKLKLMAGIGHRIKPRGENGARAKVA